MDCTPLNHPAPQFVQIVLFEDTANMPAVHDVHVTTPVLAVNRPTGQDMHELEAAAPVVARYRPAAHPVHDDAPVLTMYCPAAQPTQLAEVAAPGVAM